MVKDINISDLQKEIKALEIRINNLVINIKGINKSNKKKNKDPNSPKKPISSYMYFNKHKIDEYKKKNPDQKIKLASISKQIGQEWKTLKDDEKDKYIRLANKDKKRYEKDIASYKKKIENEMTIK